GAGGVLGAPLAITTGGEPRGLAVADFDGDGRLDFAVGCAGDGQLYLFAGRGDGTFAPPTMVQLYGAPWQLAAVDLNGDGRPDVTVSEAYGVFEVLLVGANGALALPQAFLGAAQ